MIDMNMLYVGTGNSGHSRIAEGWPRHLGGDRLWVCSAGLEAQGINANAVAAVCGHADGRWPPHD